MPNGDIDLDGIYERYVSTHAGIDSPARVDETVRRDVLPHMPSHRDARILELGCGQGTILRALRAAGYRRLFGVDLSREQIDLARRDSEGIAFIQGDLFEVLESADTPFDAIVALDVVEHLSKQDLIRCLGLVRRALASDGLFVARTPNAVGPFAGNYQFGDLTHITSLTPRSARQACLLAGFTEVNAIGCPPRRRGAVGLAQRGAWRIVSAGRAFALAAETGERGAILTQNFVFVAKSDGSHVEPSR